VTIGKIQHKLPATKGLAMEPDMVALDSLLPRRTWLKLFAVLAAAQGASAVPAGPPQQQDEEAPLLITAAMLEHALALIGLEFPTEQRELMLRTVNRQLENYEILRAIEIGYDVEPAFVFNPLLPGKTPPPQASPFPDYARRPPAARSWQSVEELAFLPVEQLSALVRERRVSSSELTRMYLARLKKYSPGLLCVVNLTEELALEQAAQADREIAAGRYRGPLHGIPWGAKDLFATKGIRTTWGVAPFREQVPDHDAAVVERLGEAGAVLIAKLSMGELAMGGDWYAGATKNPWDLQQSSSGSSAGSAVAASAGLAGFTIGTETLGSIVSPSDRCGATGLRPSFGRVSRYGAMALCWTMDKIGPICRSVEDCAIVFEAIRGVDARDRSTIEAGFAWDPGQALGELRVGVLRERFDSVSDEDKPLYEQALRALQAAGAKLEDTEFPQFPGEPLRMIIEAEAAAAFDKLGREGGFEQLRGQGQGNWPNRLRSGRLIPAPEYVNMQRARMMLMRQIDEFMSGWDVLVSPPGGNVLVAGNLTGIPEVSVPCGFDASKHPKSLRFVGRLFHEGAPLRLALAFEQATNWHSMHPPLDFG
jgi:Asp-tRNA(Asn)/Glu-tRNA(Gln) amidotransferase A subunit family amidase